MNASRVWVSVCVVMGLLTGTASALTMATVPVGNPGNVGELSGIGAGGWGPDRICGSVAYDYRIGTFEVTAGQYAEFLNKVAGRDNRLYNTNMARTDYGSGITRSGDGTADDPYTYTVASAFVNRPVNYVSYWDACRFANWMNNGQPAGAKGAGTTERGTYTLDGFNGDDGRTIQRNPGSKWAVASEDEWYKAAYYDPNKPGGAGYWDYPTRSDTAPGRDMADVSGNNANHWTGSGPDAIDSPYYTTVVGEFQNSASPYGTFDQGGNVSEWNEAIMQDSTYSYRGVRGNGYGSHDDSMHSSDRLNAPVAFENPNMGFRLVYLPEPCSALLVVVGAFGLASGRRRG